MKQVRSGFISVVLVNFRGTDDTLAAVEHLEALEWPQSRLEIIVVENASGDDSARRLKALGDRIVLVESTENLGFAGGCNLGVSHATGDIIGFLNNDARPDPQWITEAVAAFAVSPRVGAVACKVLDWEGKTVDFVDAGLTWYGMGYKPLTGDLPPEDADIPRSVLFATGSGMFVRASVYKELGGFDESFFMFFEDVDLGWRINLAGYRVRYQPTSLVFHKHHASMTSFGEYKERFLLERNALFTLFKNAGDVALREALAPALALSVRRGVSRGGLDAMEFDLRRGDDDSQRERIVAKETLAPLYAIEQFVDALPRLRKARDVIQSKRKVDDTRIAHLFRETNVPALLESHYLAGYNDIMQAFDIAKRSAGRKVMIITGDPLGAKMAGPAIRATALAKLLSLDHDVTLVSLTANKSDFDAPCRVITITPGRDRVMRAELRDTDVVIFQGLALSLFPSLSEYDGMVVADVYDPMHFEQLEQAKHAPLGEWERSVSDATEVLNLQLERADFLVCASERQRMMYLGQLAALGRILPTQYEADADLRHLIDTAPFGLDLAMPEQSHSPIKGAISGIGADDKVVIWSGGLYDWFDPHTLIRAIAELAKRRPNIRLFFQGTAHPNPDVPPMAIVEQARALSADLGVLGVNVFFNDSWVPYNDRHNYLLDADVAVSTHGQHIETTFSFRTRVLDYYWAGLPMVLTDGDSFADLTKLENTGRVVAAGDVSALADALEAMAYDEDASQEARTNIERVRLRFTWDQTLAPLVDYVNAPYHAPDRGPAGSPRARSDRRSHSVPRSGAARDLRLAWRLLTAQGPRAVAHKVRVRLTRRQQARQLSRS